MGLGNPAKHFKVKKIIGYAQHGSWVQGEKVWEWSLVLATWFIYHLISRYKGKHRGFGVQIPVLSLWVCQLGSYENQMPGQNRMCKRFMGGNAHERDRVQVCHQWRKEEGDWVGGDPLQCTPKRVILTEGAFLSRLSIKGAPLSCTASALQSGECAHGLIIRSLSFLIYKMWIISMIVRRMGYHNMVLLVWGLACHRYLIDFNSFIWYYLTLSNSPAKRVLGNILFLIIWR